MIFTEIRQRVASIETPADASRLIEELMEQVGEYKLEKPEQISIVRATFATILEMFLRDGRVTKLHPGHLAELLLDPLDAPPPVGITRRMTI